MQSHYLMWSFLFYFSSSLGIVGKTMGTLFTPVPVEVQAYEPERVGGTLFLEN